MATQVISFRASGAFLEWLQQQQSDAESLSQAAQRLLKERMDETAQTSLDPTSKTVSTLESTPVDIEKTVQTQNDFQNIAEDIAKEYYAKAMDQVNDAIAQLRGELLGEFVSLRDERDSLRQETQNLAQALQNNHPNFNPSADDPRQSFPIEQLLEIRDQVLALIRSDKLKTSKSAIDKFILKLRSCTELDRKTGS